MSTIVRKPIATPPRIVDNDGRVAAWGVFDSPFRDMNILDAKLPGIPRFLTKYRLKEWQHYAVIGEDFLFAFVAFASHYLGTSFCYFVDRKTGERIEHHREVPGESTRVARELWHAEHSFSARGYGIAIANRLDQGAHVARIEIAENKRRPAIEAQIEMHADLARIQPLIAVLPISANRPLHTHKMLCPVSGAIRVGRREVALDPARDQVLIDVQKTYYPYNTVWRWATFAGRDDRGRAIGINLVENMIEDDERYNENGFWCGGKLSLLAAARFSFDEKNVLSPWTIETTDGRCELRFTPEGERADRINLGLVVSDYHQPYGRFSGTVIDDTGAPHKIEGCVGVTEYHVARF